MYLGELVSDWSADLWDTCWMRCIHRGRRLEVVQLSDSGSRAFEICLCRYHRSDFNRMRKYSGSFLCAQSKPGLDPWPWREIEEPTGQSPYTQTATDTVEEAELDCS